ncbi:MAG: cadherin domain-containing protein [Silvanigrellaceae bacterium]
MGALQAIVKLINRWFIPRMLPVLLLVACNGLPTQQQGAARKRPASNLPSSSILDRYASEVPEIQAVYSSVSRRLTPSEMSEMEKLLSDVNDRKDIIENKARIALSGLQLSLVLLPVQKQDASRFWKRLRNIRELATFYGPELMGKLSRSQVQGASLALQPLELDSVVSKTSLEKLENSIEILSTAARGAGLELGMAASVNEVQKELSNKFEDIVKSVSIDVFTVVVPVARSAAAEIEKSGPIETKMLEKVALNVALQAVSMAKLLTGALDEGKIDKAGVVDAAEDWAVSLLQTTKQTPTDMVVSVTSENIIPTEVPNLNPLDGYYNGSLGTWLFVVEKEPSSGQLDLNSNPPSYRPAENFELMDKYSFRLCHKVYKTVCSSTFSKTIYRPIMQDTVSLVVAGRGFLPNSEATCILGPKETRASFYTWFTRAAAPGSPVVLVPGETTMTLKNTFVPRGSEVWCEVRVMDGFGLMSTPAPSLPVIVPNAWPKTLAPANLVEDVDEDIPTTLILGEFFDEDGDPLSWVILNQPGLGSLSNVTNSANSPAKGNVVYTSRLNEFGTDSITYKVCDNQQPAGCGDVQTMTINVKPINDTPSDIQLSADTVDENSPANTAIGLLSTIDADPTDTFTYTISGQHSEFLSIQGNILRTSKPIDFETHPVLSFEITSTDNGGLSITKNFTVQLMNVNEAPEDIQLSSTLLQENKPINSLVGSISSTDPDAFSSFTYKLSGPDAKSFQIYGNMLVSKSIFNFEIRNSYEVAITTSDQYGLEFTKSFTISIENVNEAPTSINLSANSIQENNVVGTFIGLATATDEDSAESHTFSLKGSDAQYFALVPQGNSTQLTSNVSFNHEARSNYSIILMVVDKSGASFEKSFTILVGNVNENPVIDSSRQEATLNEDGLLDIPLRLANDPDAGTNLNYEVTMAANGSLESPIGNPMEGGFVRYIPAGNFNGTDTFTYRVCDQGGLCSEFVPVSIIVLPVNDAPQFQTSVSSQTVSEDNILGPIAFTINDIDSEISCNDVTAESNHQALIPDANILIGGADSKNCSVTLTPLQDKNSVNTGREAEITLTLTDKDIDTVAKFSVSVTPVNDAPRDITLSNDSVFENNAPNTPVGQFSSVDPDLGNTFSYTLSGSSAAFFTVSGNTLFASVALNHESAQNHSITVTTTDQGGAKFNKTFVIKVTDINEPPTNLTISKSSVDENMPVGTEVAILGTTDQDANEQFSYTVGGVDAQYFKIEGNLLKTDALFNHENKSIYSLALKTQDKEGLSYIVNVQININDINEQPDDIHLTNSTLFENALPGSPVGAFSTSDPDNANLFTYSLSGADAGAFAIAGPNLITSQLFDFETKTLYFVNVTTTDQSGAQFTKPFTITIADVNEAPTNLALSNNVINENLPLGSPVGTLTSTDQDMNSTFTYTISGNDAPLFAINGDSLITNTVFNFEQRSTFNFDVTTYDQGLLTFTKTVTVTIRNVNESPTNIQLSSNSIAENTAAQSVVGYLSTSDPDTNGTFTYSLGGQDAASFSINGNILSTTESFNFEAKQIYNIVITSSDDENLSINKGFTIAVLDVNESPTNISLTNSTIPESLPPGSVIGLLFSTDPDEGESFTYGVGGPDSAALTVESNQLKTSAALNFEDKNSLSFSITTTDKGGSTFTKSFEVQITNINESPTDITLSGISIPENSVSGTVIGTLQTTDPDASNTFSYTLSGTDGGMFKIVGNSIIADSPLNYEEQNTFSITVTSQDQGTLSVSRTFSLAITNVNEEPTNISLSNFNIDENSPIGTTIGAFSTADPDTSNTFTYSLSGTDSDKFAVSGANLVTAAVLNRETQQSYAIDVTVTDQGGLSYSKAFTISVNDINEPPHNILMSANTVPESVAVGTIVATISAEDQDLSNTFTFALSGSDASAFEVDGPFLKTKEAFNFEVKPFFMFTLTATDQGGASFSKPFVVNILDQNEPPVDLALSNAIIPENSSTGSFIGSISVIDPDAVDTFTFSLGGPDANRFTVTGNSISTAEVFDYESKSSYILSVTVQDKGGLAFSKNFQINIMNVNESPSNILLSSNSIEENKPSGTMVATLSTTDVDAANLFVYGLSGPDAGAFSIAGNSLLSSVAFNFEIKASYSIRLTTTDQDGLSFAKDFTISVLNVNETPTDISLSTSAVTENSPVGTSVGSFSTSDPDFSGTFTYTLSGPDASAFVVSGNTLATAQTFNFEEKNSFNLTVQSSDQGGLTTSKNIVITILDANESPIDITLANASIPENQSSGALIGGLSTTDPDGGNTFTYSLSGPDAGSFTILGSLLKSNSSFDFESKNNYNISVTSTDNQGATFTKSFIIAVTDVNESPIDILFSGSTISENNNIGAAVGLFTAVDPDALNTFSWSLSGTDASAFNLSGNSLTAGISFNYESKSSFSFTITAQDQNGLSFSKNFSVAVMNMNEAPININITNATVAENQPVGTIVGTLSTDDPDTGNTFTYILGGADATSFSIVGNTLRTSASFNYEAVQSYSVTITTKDQGNLQFIKAFTINGQNVNESPIDVVLSANSIPENNALSAVVADLTTIDPDANNTFSYSVSGIDATSFSISGNQLLAAVSFNHEIKSTYVINVTTQDQGGLTYSKNVTINISNVNEYPVDISSTSLNINENLAPGTAIGNLSTSDPDAANTFVYSLGGTNAAAFSISGNTLYSAQSFNFESKANYSITITTQDQGGLAFTKSFVINVNDINETPSDITISNSSIAENVGNSTLVGTLTTTDQDAASNFTYTLSGTDAEAFSISGNTLVTSAPLNFETKFSYSFDIISTDQGGLSVSKPFIVVVTNVNEAPDNISISNTSVNENNIPGSLVATFTTSDVDASNTFTYALSGADAASFNLSGANLLAAQSFNFEAKSSYTFAVTSTDQDGLSHTKNFTINVNDINEAPTDIALSATSLQENQATGTVVGILTSTDQDTLNTFTYSVGGTDSGSFAISGNSLVTTASFNYETKTSYSISITTQDQNNLSFTKAFVISVTNVNEAPTDLSLSSTSIAENNLIGATVATLSTSDVDAGSTFTYSLSGSDASAFSISGNTLLASTSFNFENKSSYSLNVTTQDQGGLAFSKTVVVVVTNVNETPTDIAITANSISENQPVGTAVGSLTTSDPDAANTFTYSVGGTDAASFAISGSSLVTAAPINFESKTSYSISITSTDQGGLAIVKAFTVNVTNVNEAPTNITLSASSIPENNAVGAIIATLNTSDPDAASTFAYTLAGSDASSFSINGASLQAAVAFNYETKASYSFDLITTDQGGLSFTKAVTIAITNVNETPTNITLSASSINENMSIGSVVGALSTTDPDASNTFTYSLGGTDAAAFAISTSNLTTAVSLNYEAKSSYSITITTTDQGGIAYTKSFTVSINDLNEAPTNITLSNSTIDENLPSGSVVGTLTTTDPDSGNTFTYSVSGADAASFSISSGMLVTNSAFDFETKNSYSVTIASNDQGSLSTNKSFIISVSNVNEAPNNITLSATSIAENNVIGATVATLATTDVDASNTFTYALSGTDAAAFTLSGSTLSAAAAFNFESKASYSIILTTTDQGGLNFQKAFTISITNMNETPTDISLSSASVAENSAAVTTVGTFSTTDPDAGNTFTYTLAGTDAASFSLIGNTLSTASSFNYESKSSYSISITTRDQGNLQFTKTFIISITNVNEAPTNITLSTSSITENNAVNAAVATISTTDPDASSTFTYAVSGTDASSFTISGNSLLAAVSFNFEAKSTYNITLTTTDQGTLQFSKGFTITVVNANDAPTSIALSAASISENNALNAFVGTISGVDPDAVDTMTFSISGGTDAASFNVSGTNLRASSVFDFETKNSYSVTLRATDAAGATFDSTFTIAITNVNEAPVMAGGDTSKITSEDTGVSILLASGTDPDAGNTLSYLIVNPSNGTLGAPTANPSVGGSITYTPNLNFNGSDSFSYSVCDNATPSLCSTSRTVTLSITAVNDAPTITAIANQTISEDGNTGALAFTVADIDSSVNCSQVTASSSITTLIPNANLVIAGGTGTSCTITATPAANRNNVTDPGTETITLSLTDSSSATTNRNFTVTVNPVNDAPTMNAINAQSVNMNTNLAVSFVVGDIDGALACSSTYLSYSSSTPSIVAASGAVVWSGTWPNCVGTVTPVSGAFGAVNLTFQVTDAGPLSASRIFQLTVNDTRAATAPTISGAASVTSNVTNFVLNGTCTAGYTVDVSGDVSLSDMVSPFQSLTQSCPSNGNYSFTIAKSLDGQYIFRVAQTNPFNPVQSPSVSKLWTRDTVAPAEIVLSSPIENPTNSRSGTFTFMGSCEASATVNLSATAIPSSIVVSPLSTTCSSSGLFSFSQSLGADGNAASDGTYNYTLSQTDAAANTSASLSFVWVKDSAIPTTPVISTPTRNAQGIYYTNNSTSTTYPNVSVTCTTGNDVTIVENGAELITGTCSSSAYAYPVSARTDGTYIYSIYQTDTTLGKSSAVASFTWIRDILAPALPVFTNPSTSSITSPNSLYVNGTCETNATVSILVGGVADSSITCIAGAFAATVSRSVAGTYSITARQTDPAGNVSATSVAKSWTQDPNSVPIPTVTFPSTGTITNNASSLNILGVCQPTYPITIAAGSGTTLTSGEITNPPGAFVQNCAADGTFAFTIAKSNDATFNFNITQQIVSGGTSSVSAPVSWTRDTVAPTVTLSASSANPYSANAYFTFTASETVTGYQCSTDNLNYSSCTTPYSLALATSTDPTAANGIAKTLYVRATDTAQNTGASTSATWTPTVNFASLLYHFDNNGTNSSLYNATVPSNITTTGASFVAANAGFGTNAL